MSDLLTPEATTTQSAKNQNGAKQQTQPAKELKDYSKEDLKKRLAEIEKEEVLGKIQAKIPELSEEKLEDIWMLINNELVVVAKSALEKYENESTELALLKAKAPKAKAKKSATTTKGKRGKEKSDSSWIAEFRQLKLKEAGYPGSGQPKADQIKDAEQALKVVKAVKKGEKYEFESDREANLATVKEYIANKAASK